MAGTYRKYDSQKDKKSAHRIWQECGWIEANKKETDALDRFIGASSAHVYAIGGVAEALTLSTPARFLHTGSELSLAAITAVTTSRVARNQGAASGTLARALAEAGAQGTDLAGLGVFEQGFYDRLGFGTGTYVTSFRFDPAWLKNLGRPAPPARIGPKDWKAVHAALLGRRKYHGAVDLLPPDIVRCEMDWLKNVFGLGYKSRGKFTHFLLVHTDNVEDGPYYVGLLVYRTIDQLRELLMLIRGLADQVRTVAMHEPRGVQLQTLIKKPFQLQSLTRGTKNESRVKSDAYWQLRIMNLKRCIAAVKARNKLEFSLTLTDPVQKYLPAKSKWEGCGGEYTVHLGSESTVTQGHTSGLPLLQSKINDFTRWWMGAASAEVLAGLESFTGPDSLINDLDESVDIPAPFPDWDY